MVGEKAGVERLLPSPGTPGEGPGVRVFAYIGFSRPCVFPYFCVATTAKALTPDPSTEEYLLEGGIAIFPNSCGEPRTNHKILNTQSTTLFTRALRLHDFVPDDLVILGLLLHNRAP